MKELLKIVSPPEATIFYGDLSKKGKRNFHTKVKSFIDSFNSHARLLDIGSGNRRLTGEIINLDIVHFPNVNLFADAHHLPFRDSIFDGVIIQEVLEHLQEPPKALWEVYRVLKPGGTVYAEVPFVYPVHDEHDYYRWTLKGLKLLMSDFYEIESGVCMGQSSALSVMLRNYMSITPSLNIKYLRAFFYIIFGWLTFPIKYLDVILPKNPNAYRMCAGVYFIGMKKALPHNSPS